MYVYIYVFNNVKLSKHKHLYPDTGTFHETIL